MAAYDPMEELGFIHDKQLICSCIGFLQTNNSTRDICTKYIRDGDRFYDLVSRYEEIVSYVLNRDGRSGNVMREIPPFLKAFGATDYGVLQTCKESLRLMPQAEHVMNYLTDTLPTFVLTTQYEHQVLALSDALDLPVSVFKNSTLCLDDYDMKRPEGRSIREYAGTITALRMPRNIYRLNTPVAMDADDSKMITILDNIMDSKLKNTESGSLMDASLPLGSNEKAYSLLDIRKRTMIDFDGTAYIGGDMNDYQAMDLVRDGSGLALSFNGSEFAVHGCNVAVMSRDCTAAAVLVAEFYNEGIEAVFDLISNWDRETLRKRDCPDRRLMNAMLAANPRKLPEAHIVDQDNVTEIAEKSDKYRTKLLLSNY